VKIPWAQPYFWGEEQKFVVDALRSSWISGGPYVERLEKDFARYHGARFCITTSSGTSALHLALLAIGAGPGDEVIVPGFTFIAPVNMVIATGAKPVYADIDPATWCVDTACVERKISTKTKAIVAVHPYGNVCAMITLQRLARRHNLYLIEDVAEAPFSRYCGKLAGTFGDIGCFSFQATKAITTGEGGCVLTSNRKLYGMMRVIRDHGMSRKRQYWHDCLGYNFRLTNIQAALGCAQFKNLSKIISAKRKIYVLYRRYLKNEEGIRFQCFNPEVQPVVWCVTVEIDPAVFGANRDSLIRRLLSSGIETRPGFYPASTMPFYRAPSLPVAEHISARVISLPSFLAVTESQIRYVCARLKKLKKKSG
jgi:perosamine synthetase